MRSLILYWFIKAADAMILELEALMADVDNAQRALDAKKQQNTLKDHVDPDIAVRTPTADR